VYGNNRLFIHYVMLELSSKRPSESKIEHILPFSTDLKLRGNYVNSYNDLKIGLLLEDFDSLAGAVAYSHASHERLDLHYIISNQRPTIEVRNKMYESPYAIVTAAADRIDLKERLKNDKDVHLRGFVTWVGRSSMEIRIEARSIETNENISSVEPSLVAYFTMVARDRNYKATSIHKLIPETDYEKQLYKYGEENAQRRKIAKETSLALYPPTPDETQLIHKLFLESNLLILQENIKRDGPAEKFIFMEATRFQTTLFMHPQQRNIHNKVFGGFLMNVACDLAYSTCTAFSGGHAEFRSLDDTRFIVPVEIGSIVIFSAQIVYTRKLSNDSATSAVQVQVVAEVLTPATSKRATTNTFQFSYFAPFCHHVMPKTYQDAMSYLEGKRAHDLGNFARESFSIKKEK